MPSCRFLFLAFLAVLQPVVVLGQECDFHFGTWRDHDELTGLTVNAIERDEFGFVWIACEQGLKCFDGVRFYWVGEYETEANRSLGKAKLNSLAAGEDGDLWIAQDCIVQYDAKLQIFNKYQPPTAQILKRIVFDRNRSRLWVAGDDGYFWCFDTQRCEFTSQDSLLADALPAATEFSSLQLIDDGRVLIGYGKGIGCYDPDSEKFEILETSTIPVVAICNGRNGIIYFATQDSFSRILPNGQVEEFPEARNGIKCMGQMPDGRLLLGHSKGLQVYDPKSKTFANVTSSNSEHSSEFVDTIRALHVDQNGLTWIAAHNLGLHLLDPRDQHFKTIIYHDEDGLPVSGLNVRALTKDDEADSIFLASAYRGLLKYDLNSRSFQAWRRSPKVGAAGILPTSSFADVHLSKDDKLWGSSHPAGLIEVDLKTNIGTSLSSDPANGLQPKSYRKIIEVSEGKLLVSVTDFGLQLMDMKSHKVEQSFPIGETVVGGGVNSFCKTRDGRYWMCGGLGLEEMVQTTNRASGGRNSKIESYSFKHFPSPEDRHLYCVREDIKQDGVLWLGGQDSLLRFDSNTEEWTVFRLESISGIASVVSLEQDLDGDIWAATNSGLFLFNSETSRKDYFDRQNGLEVMSFARDSSLRDGNTLYFGGVGGVVKFDASAVKDSFDSGYADNMTKVVALSVYNKLVRPGSDGRLDQSLLTGGRVTLNPGERTFFFRFRALDTKLFNTSRHRFKLDGFSEKWTNARAGQKVALFKDVPPGEYQFVLENVSARDPEKTRIEIPVAVHGYIWEATWFKVLAAIATLASIYLIIRFRWMAEKRRIQNSELSHLNEELEKLVARKDDMAGILAHDLRNPLSVLRLSFDYMEAMSDEHPAKKSTMSLISQSVDRMIELIDRSLWNCRERLTVEQTSSCDLRVIDARELVVSTSEEYTSVASEKNIRLQCEVPDTPCLATADEGFARQVLANLLTNAVKFSRPETSILIQLVTSASETVQIVVTDQGLGLTKDDIRRCCTRFEKLSASPTGEEPSTGLGLYNARKLAEAMGGTLTVVSPGKDEGATFTFTLQRVAVGLSQEIDNKSPSLSGIAQSGNGLK
ncbi:ATP-binding protein [Mariniblastus sp.]|nr:ATP-binding protein [Mariniblastus sp.]